MKRAARILASIVGLALLLCPGAYALIESGEVVVLRAAPEDGHRFLARVWVVDYGEEPWISTTDPSKTDWVPWLRAHARIELERAGRASCRVPELQRGHELTQPLNSLLNAKYRIASYGSAFLKLVGGAARDESQRVWIRLEPCPRPE